jgi:hypothetical protein
MLKGLMRSLRSVKGLAGTALVLIGFEAICIWQVCSAVVQGTITSSQFNVTYDALRHPTGYRIALVGWTLGGAIGLVLIGLVLWLAVIVIRHAATAHAATSDPTRFR